MKIKNNIKIIALISVLTNISILSVGLGSYVYTKINSDELDINVGVGTYKVGIDGISINPIKTNFKMGKYLYYDDNNSSINGLLKYKIIINNNNLDNEFKIKNDDNTGYIFSLKGALSINNINIFKDNKYLNNISFNNTDIITNNITFNNSIVTFTIDINTNSFDQIENYDLVFSFSNKLILEHKQELINKKFSLLLKR